MNIKGKIQENYFLWGRREMWISNNKQKTPKIQSEANMQNSKVQ